MNLMLRRQQKKHHGDGQRLALHLQTLAAHPNGPGQEAPMTLLKTFASLVLCAALPLAAHAQTAADGCTEVMVDGYKAPDYGCLSQQLGADPQATKVAKKLREAQRPGVEKRPPNTLGLSTPAATGVRMGNTFGTSVKPQRP